MSVPEQNGTRSSPPAANPTTSTMLYKLEDDTPWFLCLLYGFQHFLVMVGSTISMPILLASILCMANDDPSRGIMVSSIIFVSGISTFLQATFGVRLPIIQGGNFAYLVPTLVLLNSNFESCTESLQMTNATAEARTEAWQSRFRLVQGAIATSSVVQILIGFTGVLGLLLRFITPLTVAPTITLVGLSLFDVASKKASENWTLCAITFTMGIIMSQHLGEVKIPCPLYSKTTGFYTVKCQPFRTLSVLLAIVITWSACWVLTVTDVLVKGSPSRTDVAGDIIHNTPWFRVPYPGQFGTPTVNVAGTVGMLAGVFSSIIESVGDYYACAKVVGTKLPPKHAINRGIGVEGIGCLLSGLIGTGSGTTSHSGNIGVIALTKVGSRRTVQYAGVIMLFCGLMGKIGAAFVTVPGPVLAGVFMIKFAIITAVGISTLQCVDLTSSRNIFIIGFSIFFGLSYPKWLEANPGAIQTGVDLLDQTLSVLLQTSMFVGGFLGLILDNTIPGTDKERGLIEWHNDVDEKDDKIKESDMSICDDSYLHSSYDLPIGMDIIRKIKWFSYVPFCPTFISFFNGRKNSTKKISLPSLC